MVPINVLTICREVFSDGIKIMSNAWKVALDNIKCQTYSVKPIYQKTLIVDQINNCH